MEESLASSRCSTETIFAEKLIDALVSNAPLTFICAANPVGSRADFGWEYQEGFLSVGLTSDWHQDQAQRDQVGQVRPMA